MKKSMIKDKKAIEIQELIWLIIAGIVVAIAIILITTVLFKKNTNELGYIMDLFRFRHVLVFLI